MRPLYQFLSILATATTLAAALPASAQDTTWFDALWHPCDIQHASYFRTSIRTSPGVKVTDHWLNGTVQMTGAYADDSLKERTGEFVFYDSTGAVDHRCNFSNNKLNGAETFYYPNGKVKMTGNLVNDEFDGRWVGYYPSGKISGKAVYSQGNETSGKFYNEDGSRNKRISKFYAESEYPGGTARWIYFLEKHLHYPDSSVIHGTEGTVIISFKVSKDGVASGFMLDQSVDPYLDEEALRVLKLSTTWEPAIFGGIYCDSYKRQPIVFKFE